MVWQDGTVLAADHPDGEAERILQAVGGEPPVCMRIAAGWGGSWSDAEVAGLRPSLAPAIWTQVVPGGVSYAVSARMARSGRSGPSVEADLRSRIDRRVMMDALPGPLRALLALTLSQGMAGARVVVDRWDPGLRARIDDALSEALRAQLGRRHTAAASAIVSIGAIEATGLATGDVAVLCPFVYRSWPARVGDRGLAIVDDHVVLDARPARDGRAEEAVAVRWEPGPDGLEPMTVAARLERGSRGWRLRWEEA